MTLTQLRSDMNQINEQLLAIGKTEEKKEIKEKKEKKEKIEKIEKIEKKVEVQPYHKIVVKT